MTLRQAGRQTGPRSQASSIAPVFNTIIFMLMSPICLTNEDFSLALMNDKAFASLQQQDVLESRCLLSCDLAAR